MNEAENRSTKIISIQSNANTAGENSMKVIPSQSSTDIAEKNTMSTVPIQSSANTEEKNFMKTVSVASLKSHPRNQEFFDDMYGEEWESFKAHIAAHGVRSAITVGKDGTITSGHQRVRACKELGITEIPALIIDYKSEDEMLLDLISTNLKQRGAGNLNPFKLGACIKELERIYGVQHGGDRKSSGPMVHLNQKDLATEFKIEFKKWQRCKQMADMIPELQELVNTEVITSRTALDIARKLPEEEQRKLISGLDPDSKYTAKQINAEIKALQDEKARLTETIKSKDAQIAADREKYNDAIKSKEAQIEADRQKYNEAIAQKDNQIEADREKYNNAVKKRDEKFNAERSQLTAEISQLNKEVDDLRAHPVKPADYDSTRKRMAMLNSENYELKDKIKRLQSEVDAYNGEAARFTKNSEEYKKLERKLEEKKRELAQLEVENAAQFEIAKLCVAARDFVENKLAPVKFKKCFKTVGSNAVTYNDLVEVVTMIENWCSEMRGVLNNVDRVNSMGSGNVIDADYTDLNNTHMETGYVVDAEYKEVGDTMLSDAVDPDENIPPLPWEEEGVYN